MQSLSHSQLKTLIQLESEGKITPKEIYKRCALAKVQAQDNYVSTAIVHAVVGVALVGLAGQLIIPIVAASWLYTWVKSYSSRQDSIRKINSGSIADYLDEDDRVSFENDMKAMETVEVPVVTAAVEPLPIGNATRLGAIAVPATVSNGFDVATNPFTIQPEVSSVNTKENDIVDLLLEQGNSLAFFGAQRSGKSRLMAIASQEGVKRGKFKHVTVLSGLAKQDEDPEYWHHSSAKGFHDLAPMARQEVDRVFADWLQKINGFRQSANVENPGLLIIDEYVYTASRCAASAPGTIAHALSQAIVELVTVVESGGAKRGWHLWIGCPSCAISGMGDMGKAMKKLQLVYCAIAKGETVDAKGIQVSWNAELFEAVKINYKSLAEPQGSEAALQGRIVFFNGKWMPQTSFKLGVQSEAKAEAKLDEGEIARAAAMVKALYQSKANEHPNMSAEFLKLAAQVKVLKDEGHHQKAFAVMIAPLGKTKTAFCHNLGVKGGTEFQKLSAVYDWAQIK